VSVRSCRALVLLIAALGWLTGCTTAPITGRKQVNFVSASTETQLGVESFAEVKRQHKISQDPAANAMVQRVGRRIAAASKLQADWEFIVIDEPVVNAFALPGGKVAVYKGILAVAQNDAGLATVLGHEVGHVMAHHAGERISRSTLVEAGTEALAAGISSDPGTRQTVGAMLGAGATFGLVLPFSREQEYEADQIGLVLMARAGSDPRQAIGFWQRMQAKAGAGQPPEFFSDHPSDANRIARLQSLMPAALKEYHPAP